MDSNVMKDLSILVVDDNEPMLLLLRRHLGDFGFRNVSTARDGWEALDAIRARCPDLVITDHQMEPMNGVSLVRILRGSGDPRMTALPIIMMTAYASAEILHDAVAAEVDEFLAKPISEATLRERILNVLRKAAARGRMAVEESEHFAEPATAPGGISPRHLDG